MRAVHVPLKAKGLSPRVRGNPSPRAKRVACLGSIPACAGEPNEQHTNDPLSKVYPRVCGGTYFESNADRNSDGLSPRVRGNRMGHYLWGQWVRSIPACAGEPCSRRAMSALRAVYPRVCGGTELLANGHKPGWGLSPRVRGNPVSVGTRSQTGWSIPACAGEPPRRPILGRLMRVYPRVCGGTRQGWCWQRFVQGLSPRVRGEPDPPVGVDGAVVVYPRVCGGTNPYGVMGLMEGGLSPRVRGNHYHSRGSSGRLRSIPACAGEPSLEELAEGAIRVYPRVCGGTLSPHGLHIIGRGLSPRVRGNPQ